MPQYSYSTDEERYQGHFDSPEDAAAEALYADPDLESVFVGEIREPAVRDFVSASQILDDVDQQAFDECGECCEDWLDDLRHSAPLLAELEDLVGAWIEKHAPPWFWIVVNVREITRAEMVAAGQLDAERE